MELAHPAETQATQLSQTSDSLPTHTAHLDHIMMTPDGGGADQDDDHEDDRQQQQQAAASTEQGQAPSAEAELKSEAGVADGVEQEKGKATATTGKAKRGKGPGRAQSQMSREELEALPAAGLPSATPMLPGQPPPTQHREERRPDLQPSPETAPNLPIPTSSPTPPKSPQLHESAVAVMRELLMSRVEAAMWQHRQCTAKKVAWMRARVLKAWSQDLEQVTLSLEFFFNQKMMAECSSQVQSLVHEVSSLCQPLLAALAQPVSAAMPTAQAAELSQQQLQERLCSLLDKKLQEAGYPEQDMSIVRRLVGAEWSKGFEQLTVSLNLRLQNPAMYPHVVGAVQQVKLLAQPRAPTVSESMMSRYDRAALLSSTSVDGKAAAAALKRAVEEAVAATEATWKGRLQGVDDDNAALRQQCRQVPLRATALHLSHSCFSPPFSHLPVP